MTLYPRRRLPRYLIYAVCLTLILIALDMLWARSLREIPHRYDTTRIVEPTRDDGSIDYLTAIETYFSRGVTPENNAAPFLLRALGRAALPKTQPPNGITSRLGMPPLPEKGDYFVTFENWTKARTGRSVELNFDDNPVSLQPLPAIVAEWLAAEAGPLAEIHEATRRSRYFLPFNGGNPPDMVISVLLPHLYLMREAGRSLALRARARAIAGDGAGAMRDAMTLHRLAHLLSMSPTLIERSVANLLEDRACDADRVVAAAGKPSARTLREYAAELAAAGDLESPAAAIDDGERFMALDTVQRLASLPPTEAGRVYDAVANDRYAPPPRLFPFLPVPYERMMIVTNTWNDGLLVAIGRPTYAQRRDALLKWSRGGQAVSENHRRLGVCSADRFLGLFMPNIVHFETNWEISRAKARLSRITLLLAAWRVDHGRFPDSLAELERSDGAPLPLDNFTARPFLYTRTSSGYTLHSPGPDMTDDDGGNDDVTAHSL